jgi:hypothetical protein
MTGPPDCGGNGRGGDGYDGGGGGSGYGPGGGGGVSRREEVMIALLTCGHSVLLGESRKGFLG